MRLGDLLGKTTAKAVRARPSLNILITQRALQLFGGTEMVTAELAREMRARGHRVAVYCPKPGKIANIITSGGTTVHDSLSEVPFVPDVIHGHHHLPLMAALVQFPCTPALHVWHGTRPWVEKVPHHSNIAAHAVPSARMAQRLTAEYGIEPTRITVIPNTVDTVRYSQIRPVADHPHSALLYAGGGFDAEELQLLEHACASNDLSLDKIGNDYGNPRPRPEYFLPDYDIVFAIGRAALEALACGCAVLPIVPQLAGSRIRHDTLDDWTDINFSPRYFTSAERFDSAWLRSEIANWAPDDITAVTQTVRRNFALDQAISAYEDLYHSTVAPHPAQANGPDMARHMEWLAKEVDTFWQGAQVNNTELEQLRESNDRLRTAARHSEQRVHHLMQVLLGLKGVSLPVGDVQTPPDTLREAIQLSGLFDAEWYLERHPTVAQQGHDPLTHYLRLGASVGLDPSPNFDSAAYLEANPHLRGLGINPLEHFLRQLGQLTGPATSPKYHLKAGE